MILFEKPTNDTGKKKHAKHRGDAEKPLTLLSINVLILSPKTNRISIPPFPMKNMPRLKFNASPNTHQDAESKTLTTITNAPDNSC